MFFTIKAFLIYTCICHANFGSTEDVVDCTSDDIVTSIFNEPIELTYNGTIRIYENVVINELSSTTNNEFEKNYIDARLQLDPESGTKNLIIYTTAAFSAYALEQSATRITLKIALGCDMGRERTLVFFQPIKEDNYFRPRFSSDMYEIAIPTPLFAGFDLSAFIEISAKDDDIYNNQIAFTSPDADGLYIKVGTKNETSADKKTYFANLTLNRIYLSLPQEISFQIVATDNGIPPLSAAAVVIIRADAANSLPPIPRFERSLYQATLSPQLVLEPFTVTLSMDTYSQAVNFSMLGEDQTWFSLVNERNVVTLFLNNVPSLEAVKGLKYLQFEVKAEHANLTDFGRTAVIVELPNRKENFRFTQALYEGTIDAVGQLQIEPIVFDPNAFDYELTFQLNGTGMELFTFEQSENTLVLQLLDGSDLEPFKVESFIKLQVTAKRDDLTTTTGILIKLPRDDSNKIAVQPIFKQPLYVGNLSKALELRLETIVLLPETYVFDKTEFSLNGSDNFELSISRNEVQIFLKREIEQESLGQNATILLILTAKNDGLLAHASIVIENEAAKNTTTVSERVFVERWQVGYIDLDANMLQVLHLSEISIGPERQVNEFLFTLEGIEASYFTIGITAPQKIIIMQVRPLEDAIFTHKLQLNLKLHAIKKAQPQQNDTSLVFIELYAPREDCSTPAPLASLPQFDSSAYVFAAKPNQLGSLALVGATIQSPGASLRYSLNVTNDHLRQRMAINTNTGELMLLSYISAGVYNFEISAENMVDHGRATVQARLDVDTILQCDEQQVIVANALITKYIEEEKEYVDIMNMAVEGCHYDIIFMYPNDKAYVYINASTRMLSTIAIDREDTIFANMSVPQVAVKLKLVCSGDADRNSGDADRIGSDFFPQVENPALILLDDIAYSKDVTFLHLIIVDINDNPPEFVEPSKPLQLAYPEGRITLELFPQYLTQVRAIDKDAGSNAQIRYALSPNKHFDIDPQTGIIYPKANALKSQAAIELVALATDRDGDGYTTGLVLKVRRLTAAYFTLLTFTGSDKLELESRLKELNNSTGFSIMLMKYATLPVNNTTPATTKRMFVFRVDRDFGDDAVVQKAWIYAFDSRNQPVSCAAFQDKLAAMPAEVAPLAVESYEEVGLTTKPNGPSDAGYSKAIEDDTDYVVAIVVLGLISGIFICFLLWRFYAFNYSCLDCWSSLKSTSDYSGKASCSAGNTETQHELNGLGHVITQPPTGNDYTCGRRSPQNKCSQITERL